MHACMNAFTKVGLSFAAFVLCVVVGLRLHRDLITGAGSAAAAAPAAAAAAPAAAGGGAPAEKGGKAAKQEEPEEEEDADMGFSLFD